MRTGGPVFLVGSKGFKRKLFLEPWYGTVPVQRGFCCKFIVSAKLFTVWCDVRPRLLILVDKEIP